MWQQSNTTGRNTSCSAEHPSSSCRACLSASPRNPPEGSPGWLLQLPTRGLPSRGRHFRFPSLLQNCLFTESQNNMWFYIHIWIYIIISIIIYYFVQPYGSLCCHTTQRPYTSPRTTSTGESAKRSRDGFHLNPRGVTPNPSGDLALLPTVTVPMGSTWLKATKQLLFVELGGERRTPHELCTKRRGMAAHTH